MSESKIRTIPLTDRPPVKISEDEWPEVASASYQDYDNEHVFQANRHWRGFVRVRKHEDGRAIVYARCWYDSAFRGDRGYDQRAGELLGKQSAVEEIILAIKRVHASIDVVDDGHAQAWRLLAAECIADLPVEEI